MASESSPLLSKKLDDPSSFRARFMDLCCSPPVTGLMLLSNVKSGITVSLVNIPLSISLAMASGVSPVAGIVTAFWAGVMSSMFGGCVFNIVGPTGALSGILLAASTQFGPEMIPFLAIWTGVISLVVWMCNLAEYAIFIPSAVIHGFTLGVALIIACGQIDYAAGLSFEHVEHEFLPRVLESVKHLGSADAYALVFFLFNFAFLVIMSQKMRKVPAALLVTVFGIGIGYLSTHGMIGSTRLMTLEDKFGILTLNIISFPSFSAVNPFRLSVLSSSLAVAFIAILETLISARMADQLTKTNHSQRREVFGLSIANLFSGAFGGVPATAALARTVLNIRAGATSRISALVNAVVLLPICLALLRWFEYLPLPSVAAMLVKVAWRMADFHHFMHLFKFDRLMFFVGIFTAGICFAVDTSVGLVTGSLVSLLLFTKEMAMGHCEMQLNIQKDIVALIDVPQLDLKPIELPHHLARPPSRHAQSESSKGGPSRGKRTPSPDEKRSEGSGDAGGWGRRSAGGSDSDSDVEKLEAGLVDSATYRREHPVKLNGDRPDSRGGDDIPDLPIRLTSSLVAARANLPKDGGLLTPAEDEEESDDIRVADADTLVYRFVGQLTYINTSAHLLRTKKFLNRADGIRNAVLVLRSLSYVDLDGVDALTEIVKTYSDKGIGVCLTGVQNAVAKALDPHEFYRKLLLEGRVFSSSIVALDVLYPMKRRRGDLRQSISNISFALKSAGHDLD